MDKKRWTKVREIFAYLSEQTPSFRQDYLNMVCADDPALQHDVNAMLKAHDKVTHNGAVTLPIFQQALPSHLGDYAITGVLGTGGMSKVYRASHPDIGDVAIKCLPASLLGHPATQARFKREAKILETIRHPGLCRLHEVLHLGNAIALVMELVEGQTLDAKLNTGPLVFTQAIAVAYDVADILAVTHAAGVVHRDIKPSNIMLTESGVTRLIDFGVAAAPEARLTMTGELIGSPVYMSPEQWRGGAINAGTDIWSLGVLLYHMLCGRLPFAADNLTDLSHRILTAAPAAMPPQSVDLQTLEPIQPLILTLLSKDRQGRPDTIKNVRSQLARLIDS